MTIERLEKQKKMYRARALKMEEKKLQAELDCAKTATSELREAIKLEVDRLEPTSAQVKDNLVNRL